MRLYIIPTENDCNATCPCCTTKLKKETRFGERLDSKHLEKIRDLDVDEIHISGGGEPFLNKRICEIISKCIDKAPTEVYTNGQNVLARGCRLRKLKYLCVSRLHNEEGKNIKLMGVKRFRILDMHRLFVPLKLSIVLMKKCVSNARELRKFLNWSSDVIKAKAVVVKQMAKFDYPNNVQGMFISAEKVFKEMQINDYERNEYGNPIFRFKKMDVEIEENGIYEINCLVMRSDGIIYKGWGDEVYESPKDTIEEAKNE